MTKEDNLRRAAYKFYRNSYDLPKKEIPSLASGDKLTIEVMTTFATSPAAQEYWNGWMLIEGEYKLPNLGEWCLLFNGYWTGVGKRNRIEEGDSIETMWEDETSEYITPYPTHWQPLPQPPITDKTQSA